MSHFNVSLIVWAKSRDSVHKPQFLKRRERRAEADHEHAVDYAEEEEELCDECTETMTLGSRSLLPHGLSPSLQ